MTDLERLAERVEAAEGPSRKLDLAIAVAVNSDDMFDAHYEWRWGCGGDEIEAWEPDKRKPTGYLDPAQFCPPVTRSLDAAMTLVPEGHCVSAMGEVPDDREWYVEIWKEGEGYHQGEVRGKSAALALTAAALRARSAMEGDG
jgi:hypothetical protein